MKLYIKNMVCNRCIMVVKSEMEKLGIHPVNVELGEVRIEGEISPQKMAILDQRIKELGFELIDNARSRIIENIKKTIIQLIHHSDLQPRVNFSDYLASRLNRDYGTLSHLFSEVEGVTIEKYVILQKIERVKELLVYDELTLSEIAFQMGYSSVAYLSGQFTKVTGLTPSHFKRLGEKKRKPIDKIKG